MRAGRESHLALARTQASCPSTDSPPPLSHWANRNGSAHCGDLTVCAGLSQDPLGTLAEPRTGTGQGCRAGLPSCHHSMLSARTHARTHALEGAGLGAKSDGNCGSHCRLDAAGRHRGTHTELGACELQGLEVPSITTPHTHLEVNLNQCPQHSTSWLGPRLPIKPVSFFKLSVSV